MNRHFIQISGLLTLVLSLPLILLRSTFLLHQLILIKITLSLQKLTSFFVTLFNKFGGTGYVKPLVKIFTSSRKILNSGKLLLWERFKKHLNLIFRKTIFYGTIRRLVKRFLTLSKFPLVSSIQKVSY